MSVTVAGVKFFKSVEGQLILAGEVDFLEPNLNLLAHAQAIELEVGSRCGGHGICGGDRLRILTRVDALNPATEVERTHISAADLRAGVRLGCQSYPNRADTIIEVELVR